MNLQEALDALELDSAALKTSGLDVYSPIDGSRIAAIKKDSKEQVKQKISVAVQAFNQWREVPAPKRGELMRLFAEELRRHKQSLGTLVTYECGKIFQEGLGEVQEMIDICDFAVGLSRQLYGLTIASERPGHKMSEYWHPLGVVGVISAFNFPVAVWAWNAALAYVCGNSVVWKPSEKTPVTALACERIFKKAVARYEGEVPEGLLQIIIGERDVGQQLVDDARVPLISATGSCRMGREVGPRVAQRFGRSLLELGGNNAIIVTPSADLELAARGILFGAVGTAGQRCTSTRRLIVHADIYDQLISRLKKSYGSIRIGDPMEQNTLVGPLIDKASFDAMQTALTTIRKEGGNVTGGERVLTDRWPHAYYVKPALVEVAGMSDTIRNETFAPILYVLKYRDFEDAIAIHNDVPQGLSSAIFTNNILEAEYFLSVNGSDCGIANVNIGTSGAEIGGAFGGEKETGGGRESGSDAWKNYMRRTTSTVNYTRELPLAQGIRFDAD